MVSGYALLGATWLMLKTDGDIAQRAAGARTKFGVRRHAGVHGGGEPLHAARHPRIAQRWFSMPNLLYLAPVPLLTALVAFQQWRWIAARRDAAPFFAAIALFLLGYLGLAISNYPYLVPTALTFRQAAAAPSSQTFMLIGTLVLLPAILGYTAFVYWLFRGKVREGAAYH